MSNKEKFLHLVSAEQTNTEEKNRLLIENRSMLRESQNIAKKILFKLDELDWTQKDLAVRMDVSPQQISKLLSGKENMSIKTLVKLQEILNIPVLASYYETKSAKHKKEKVI